MKKVAIYARVSSDAQRKEKTIESQIAELKRQVNKAGNELVKEYVDDGHSGALLDRPAMNQLREDLKSNAFEVIYFLAADRIARDSTYQNIIIGEIIYAKKQIVIGGKDYVDNPENKFTLTVLGAVSEFERARIIERSMRGRKHWLKQGVLMSNGCQLFGYRYHRRTDSVNPWYEINEKEAKIVRQIFETYAKGDVSFVQMAKLLENKGTYRRPKSAQWKDSHIRSILHNETYIGIRYFDTMTDAHAEDDPMHKTAKRTMMMRDRKDWIGIPIPAIISKELFEKVQTILKHNESCYRNAREKQLLSGLIWCGKCGFRMFSFRQYFQIKRSKEIVKIYEKYLYTCLGRKKKLHCTTMQLDIRPIESLVFELIRENMTQVTKLENCLVTTARKTDPQKTKKLIGDLKQKIKSIGEKQNRIVDLYASGGLSKEEYLKRIGTYDEETKTVNDKITGACNRVPFTFEEKEMETALENHCAKIHERLEECNNPETKRRFLLDFIEKVTYKNDRIMIHGSLPVGNGKIEFAAKRMIDREKLRDDLLIQDRKSGIRGTPIRRVHFGHLLSKQAKVLNKEKT